MCLGAPLLRPAPRVWVHAIAAGQGGERVASVQAFGGEGIRAAWSPREDFLRELSSKGDKKTPIPPKNFGKLGF